MQAFETLCKAPFKRPRTRMLPKRTYKRASAQSDVALSNKFRLTAPDHRNKRRSAVGYCTLYGDMSGGLAVISDVPKTMVYRFGALVNRTAERIPDRC